jgi:cytidylate kinase
MEYIGQIKMPTNLPFAYKNITISGLPGAGSTTLLKMLKKALPDWQGFSGGEFMRLYATEKGLFDASNKLHHSSLVYGDDFDKEVDFGMRSKLETQEKWILESWLSGFVAQNVPGVLKILMTCSDEAIKIDRLVNRDSITVEVAKEHIHKRYEENLGKWSRLYAKEWQEWVVATGKVSQAEPIDFWRPDLYDVVIDTYSTNREQTLAKVLDVLKKKKS